MSGTGRPGSESGKETEPRGADHEHGGVCPVGEPRAEASDRAGEPDAAAPAAREEVDRADEERQQRGDESELDRPALDDAPAEEEVARRRLVELQSAVERADEPLNRAPELAEPLLVDLRVPEQRLGNVRRGRDRDRRRAAGDEDALLVEREREGEVEELLRPAGVPRLPAGLLGDAGDGGPNELGGGRTWPVCRQDQPWRHPAAERVEAEDGDGVGRERGLLGEARRAQSAVGAAVRRDEDEAVGGPHAGAAGPRQRRVGPRELDQRGGSGGVVDRARPGSVVVAVGHDHDRPGRCTLGDRDDVVQLHVAAARDRRREGVGSAGEAVRLELVAEPLRCAERPGEPGARSGYSSASSSARSAAASPSKVGGSAGRGSGCGRPTVNATSSSGSATSSQVPRTVRALIGCWIEARRGRKRRPAGAGDLCRAMAGL